MDYDFNSFARDYRNLIRETANREDLFAEDKKKLLEEKFNEWTEVRDDLDGGRYPRRDLYPNTDFDKLTNAQKNYWRVFT